MAGGGGVGGAFGAKNPIRAYYAFCVNMSTIFKYQESDTLVSSSSIDAWPTPALSV
jgi:hypothetical protein